MTLRLDADQERDAQRIAHEPSGGALDASTMSAGKTVVALRAASIRKDRVIVICGPLQTRGGWQGTAQAGWIPPGGHAEDMANLPFHWIRNHKDGQRAIGLLMFNTPGIYFIGHEYAVALAWDVVGERPLWDENGAPKIDKRTGKQKTKQLKKYNGFWDKIHPDMLIVDEIHRGNITTTAMRFKTLSHMVPKFMLGLSGTAMGNRFDGIYPVSKLIWPDYVPKDAQTFKRQFCTYDYDPHSWDHMKVTGEAEEGAYFKWLPCVVRRVWEYEGVIDRQEVYVELGTAQRRAYNDLERSMATWLDEHPFVIEFPATLRVRLRQATLGLFSVNEFDEVVFREDCKSSKLEKLYEILEKDFESEPALILTDSRKFADVSVARLNQKYGAVAEVWSGTQSQKQRDETKARFMDHTTKYVVMVIKAGGTGTDGLQYASHNIVVMSNDDSRIENEQALFRTIRRGQGMLVRLRYIIATDTYDEGILHGQLAQEVQMRRSMDLTGVN